MRAGTGARAEGRTARPSASHRFAGRSAGPFSFLAAAALRCCCAARAGAESVRRLRVMVGAVAGRGIRVCCWLDGASGGPGVPDA